MAAVATPPSPPNITYAPNFTTYQALTAYRLATEDLPTSLPPGFPAELKSDLVWDNTDIATRYDWTLVLSASDLEELDAALRHFKTLGLPLGYIDQFTFPLGDLHGKLRRVSRDVHLGFGFKVVRGLPVDEYSRADILALYAGLAAHVASTRGRQDHQWDGKPADVVLNHICDLSGGLASAKIGAPAYTADKQVFHTDSGDVIALLCLSPAAEGGESMLASSGRVYNALARTRPDIIHTLSTPWIAETFDGVGNGFQERPLLFHQPASPTAPERLILQYARRTFTGYAALPRSPTLPPLSPAQAEALDALHFLASQYSLTLDFQKGDIQFVNNLSIFHARDAFTDSAETRRHLVRLWLRDEELRWEIPRALGERWERVYGGVERGRQVFPLEPFVRSAAAAGKGGGAGGKGGVGGEGMG